MAETELLKLEQNVEQARTILSNYLASLTIRDEHERNKQINKLTSELKMIDDSSKDAG